MRSMLVGYWLSVPKCRRQDLQNTSCKRTILGGSNAIRMDLVRHALDLEHVCNSFPLPAVLISFCRDRPNANDAL
jgi:hypothetical protein